MSPGSVMYFWLVIDPIDRDALKVVEAPSKLDALHVAADEWGYTEENEEVRDEFVAEALTTPLTEAQAEALHLSKYVFTRWGNS